MKKIITTFCFAIAVHAGLNAKVVYVASSGDNSDGTTWATAYTSIPTNSSTAIAAGDSVFVKTGTYTLSQSTAGWACLATKADVNYLGGFVGTETNSAQRLTSDLDGNGVVESWEFSNATVLNLTATNNAYGLFLTANTVAPKVFDGFKLTGSTAMSVTGTATTYANGFIKLNGYNTFQNNTISGVAFTEDISTSGAWGGTVQGGIVGLFNSNNTLWQCLIEKNTAVITATATQYDSQLSPMVYLAAGNASGRNVCANTIIRNNQVTIDCSGVTSMSYNNSRGMIVSVYTTNASGAKANAVKNLVIHNNSITFNPKTGSAANTNLGNGGLLFVDNAQTVGNTDSILNCTVANNKMTRIGYAFRIGYSNTSGNAHVVANNVGFNNYNYKDDGTYEMRNLVCWNTGTNLNNIIASNITNGGMGLSTAAGVTVNNLTDLADTNTGTKAPYFSNPTTVVGYTADGTVETSRWNPGTGSYLLEKGVVTSNKTDKAGQAFSLTAPAVGSYEFVSGITTAINNLYSTELVSPAEHGLINHAKGFMQIYNPGGQLLVSTQVEAGKHIALPSGAYILRHHSLRGIHTQKIIL